MIYVEAYNGEMWGGGNNYLVDLTLRAPIVSIVEQNLTVAVLIDSSTDEATIEQQLPIAFSNETISF